VIWLRVSKKKKSITDGYNHRDEDVSHATGSALPRTNLFLENSIIQDEDSGVVLEAKGKRLEKKRRRQISVSKL
jgi:hypothetical protein